MKRALLLAAWLPLSAWADDAGRIADAIRLAEGRWTYGIKTVRVRTEAEARRICLNTIRHAWADWNRRGDFINFLADRYCPPSADPMGNRRWKHNVHWLLNHA